MLLTALLGSIIDSLTLTGKFVYAKYFEVRLKVLNDLAKY